MNAYKDITAAVGGTPLVRINKLINGATVLAKLASRKQPDAWSRDWGLCWL